MKNTLSTLMTIASLAIATITSARTLGPHKVIHDIFATVEKEDIEHLYPISDKTGKRVRIDWVLKGEAVFLKQGSQVFVEISYPSEFLDQVRVEGYPKLLWVSDEELD
jgi:hypothetical protein